MLQRKIQKTLILVPDLNIPGGVSNYYKTLELNTNKNITYFTINKATPQTKSASVYRLFKKYILFSFKVIKNNTVIINPSLDEGKSFHRDMIFILITHFFNKQSIVFFRGWFDPYESRIKKSKLKSLLFKVSYAKADKYIVLGNIFKEKLLQLGVPYKNQFFIETTVADSKYLKEFDLNCKLSTYKKEVHFVFLSRIEKEKGIYIAIDAFRKFTENNPERPSKLVIAGDGPDLPAVKKYIETNKIVNIILLGHVHAETKRKVLFESHVMIFPSFTEGLPNVILEGMLYGMPIISRAVGGIPEVVKEGINGFLTSSFDSNIFEGFLSKIANDLDLYKTIAIKNHEIGMKRFTSEKVKERILQIIGNSEILNK